jgi:predicted DNA-binding protein with PD1-like motif
LTLTVTKMNMAKGEISDILVIRLKRGEEIKAGVMEACRKYEIKNAVIMSMVGSLNGAVYYDPVMNPDVKCGVSYADPISLERPVQLLSAHGEVCHRDDGELYIHIHATFADSQGNAYGGHLADEGNQALCTVNIFVGVIAGVEMGFEWDEIMGDTMFCPKEV